MIAFAGNSLLCRLALKQTAIDPTSFTFIRLLSGAIVLLILGEVGRRLRASSSSSLSHGNWFSALALFAYASAFSFAYVTLSAGTGALLLFGAVQGTMIFWGWRRGERLRLKQLAGLTLALAGLVLLLLPGLTAPPVRGSILMISAGAAWGIYSLRGRAETDPARATTGNFVRAVPFAVILSLAFWPWRNIDPAGAGYAALSGAVASGLGYIVWYAVLPNLKAASAATVQLSVPALAATGGILLLNEQLTWRLFVASIAILGGIALVVTNPSKQQKRAS